MNKKGMGMVMVGIILGVLFLTIAALSYGGRIKDGLQFTTSLLPTKGDTEEDMYQHIFSLLDQGQVGYARAADLAGEYLTTFPDADRRDEVAYYRVYGLYRTDRVSEALSFLRAYLYDVSENRLAQGYFSDLLYVLKTDTFDSENYKQFILGDNQPATFPSPGHNFLGIPPTSHTLDRLEFDAFYRAALVSTARCEDAEELLPFFFRATPDWNSVSYTQYLFLFAQRSSSQLPPLLSLEESVVSSFFSDASCSAALSAFVRLKTEEPFSLYVPSDSVIDLAEPYRHGDFLSLDFDYYHTQSELIAPFSDLYTDASVDTVYALAAAVIPYWQPYSIWEIDADGNRVSELTAVPEEGSGIDYMELFPRWHITDSANQRLLPILRLYKELYDLKGDSTEEAELLVKAQEVSSAVSTYQFFSSIRLRPHPELPAYPLVDIRMYFPPESHQEVLYEWIQFTNKQHKNVVLVPMSAIEAIQEYVDEIINQSNTPGGEES